MRLLTLPLSLPAYALRRNRPGSGGMRRARRIASVTLIFLPLLLLLSCTPRLSEGPAPSLAPSSTAGGELPAPSSSPPPDPTPNIEATLEVMVARQVKEALAAVPTIAPVTGEMPVLPPPPKTTPGATPPISDFPTAAGREAVSDRPDQPAQLDAAGHSDAAVPAGSSTGPSLAEMVEQVKPGVVRINASSGVGSGVVLEARDDGSGLVLTNYHVVGDAYRIDVLVGDSRTFRGKVVGFDETRDVAVLEICCDQFHPLRFSGRDEVTPGSEVVAIGYALGLAGNATVTRGIVSAVRYHPALKAWVIQTDASINPGNSGGPLLLATGEVIGIATFIQNRDNQGKPTEGLGFALSERTVRELLPDLLAGARVSASSGNSGGSGPDGVDWQTYFNAVHGYSVDVPADWSIDESDMSHVHLDSPDGVAGLNVVAYSGDVDTMDGWLDEAIDRHRDFYGGRFQLLKREDVTYSDGSESASVVFRAQFSRRFCVLRVTELYSRGAGVNLVASFQLCEHSLAAYAPVQQTALSSFTPP